MWIHEEDVPWIIPYLAEEVAIGGVEPIEGTDEEVEDECEEASKAAILDGAAVAALSEDGAAVPAPSEERGEVMSHQKKNNKNNNREGEVNRKHM